MRRIAPILPAGLAGTLTRTVVMVAAYSTPHGPELGRGGELVAAARGFTPDILRGIDPGFEAELGQCARVDVTQDALHTTVLLVGLGSRSDASTDVIRSAAQGSAHEVKTVSVISSLALELDEPVAAVRAVAEGMSLGGFQFQRVNGSPDATDDSDAEIRILVDSDADSELITAAIHLGSVYADSTNWVRQLVETPSNHLGPADLAAAIAAYSEEVAPGALDVSVWSVDDMAERGFGATLAVGRGSERAPCVVELRSRVGGPVLGIAGKGITYDAGGINIKKDASELAWMKSDMAGAASVAAAVIAVAGLGELPGIHAILPLADNMPSGDSIRPGDVVVHPNGRSTEVVDTDCEGRLVLADAIAWLSATKPTAIIDVGTLTDSGGVGTAMWGCWTNEPALAAELTAAGTAAGDPGWVLPLHPSYRPLLKSTVADSRNAAADAPDSGQLAAMFLEPFAGKVPWVHIDNGSGAYLEWDTAQWKQGPTGTPTRALMEYLRRSHGGLHDV